MSLIYFYIFRFDILKKILKATQINEEDLREAAYSAHGFVGADLISLCSRAALNTSKRNASCLNLDDFKFALHRVRPSAMREVQIEVKYILSVSFFLTFSFILRFRMLNGLI